MKFVDARDISIEAVVIEDRQRHNLGDIDTLAISISTYGLMEPIIVQDIGNGKFKLIDGERRLKATQSLKRTRIAARLYENLDEVIRKKLELELNIRRKALSPVEEARAIRTIFEAERKNYEHKLPGRFGRGYTQQDLAVQLDMPQSTISRALKIAEAADSDPTLELCTTRAEVLEKISETGLLSIRGTSSFRQIEESMIVDEPFNYLDSAARGSIDLLIMDIDKIKSNMFETLHAKLRVGGSIIIFHPMILTANLVSAALKQGFFCKDVPYIWHCGKENLYVCYSWFGKNRENPLRAMQLHATYTRDNELHTKAKPFALMQALIKFNSEPGSFVVVAPCFDLDSIKAAIEAKRNIVGIYPNKILKEKLMLQETNK